MIAKRMSAFSAYAAAIETGPAILPISKFAYAILGAMLFADVAYVWISDFTWGSGPYANLLCIFLMSVGSALLARRYQMPRIAAFLEATSFTGLAGLLTVCATLIGGSLSGPFIDSQLIAADRALGYDWHAVFQLSRAHPWVVHMLDYAYASMGLQLIAVPVLLTIHGHSFRKWGFLTAWMVASLITILVFPFAPAEGAPIHFGLHPDAYSKSWFWQFGPRILQLQVGDIRDISSGAMGIVSVPSFHAATGVMFIWAVWHLKWLRLPSSILNALMVISTPISGVHYMVDVLAGLAVGCASVVIARRLVTAGNETDETVKRFWLRPQSPLGELVDAET